MDWVFTTPLMLIELGILAGAHQRQTLTLIDARVAGKLIPESAFKHLFEQKQAVMVTWHVVSASWPKHAKTGMNNR